MSEEEKKKKERMREFEKKMLEKYRTPQPSKKLLAELNDVIAQLEKYGYVKYFRKY